MSTQQIMDKVYPTLVGIKQELKTAKYNLVHRIRAT